MKIIPVILISILLTGCGFLKKPDKPEPAAVPEITTQKFNIDSGLLVLCPRLPETLAITSFEDVVAVYGELATQYVACANRQADSVRVLKQIGNIK